MSASTYDAAGETDAGTGDRIPDRRGISAKAIAEMDLLHQAVLDARPATRWGSIASRRRYRDARVAESDLLRALGFESWEAFDARVGPRREPEPEPEPEPDADVVVDLVDIADLVGLVLQQLADTRADLQALRASSARVDDVIDRALMEIVALRLELVVMATRAQSAT